MSHVLAADDGERGKCWRAFQQDDERVESKPIEVNGTKLDELRTGTKQQRQRAGRDADPVRSNFERL